MGGDGGVIASNRKYLRGAGTANHTADAARHSQVEDTSTPPLRTCHLTQAPLQYQNPIVACPYGRLYQKEAAVEALLRRSSEKDALGSHIRGLKDLHPVRFHLTNGVPACPVTGVELNNQHPAVLIVSKHNNKEGVNVLSERAKKEMGLDALQTDYGPFCQDDLIRLAPPRKLLESIQEELQAKRENSKKKKEGKPKKRKKHKPSSLENPPRSGSSKKLKTGVAEAARVRVASAVASNDVLSSLFTSDASTVSEKEKKDNLFARMG